MTAAAFGRVSAQGRLSNSSGLVSVVRRSRGTYRVTLTQPFSSPDYQVVPLVEDTGRNIPPYAEIDQRTLSTFDIQWRNSSNVLNDYDFTLTVYSSDIVKGDPGRDGRDGRDGSDSTVPGPPGRDGSDASVTSANIIRAVSGTPTNNQIIEYDSSSSRLQFTDPPSGGGGTAPTISNIISAIGGSPSDEQVLTYEATGPTLQWQDIPTPPPAITPVPYVTGDPHYWVSTGDARTVSLILHDIDITPTNTNTNRIIIGIGGNPFTIAPWTVATGTRRVNIEVSALQADNITNNATSGRVDINVDLRQDSTSLQSFRSTLPVIVSGKEIALKEDIVSSGGGTTVVANPTTDSSDPAISSITIGTTDYRISGRRGARGPAGDDASVTVANILSAIGGSPTDEQVLTYEATGPTLEWQTVTSGGGGTTVVANPSVDSSDPQLNSITIGSSDYRIVGQKGDRGERGLQGVPGRDSTVPGPAGVAGRDGSDASVTSANIVRAVNGTPTDDQIIQYDAANTRLEFATLPTPQRGEKGEKGDKGDTGAASTVPGPAGAPGRDGSDASVTSANIVRAVSGTPTDNQIIQYDSANSRLEFQDPPSGGGGIVEGFTSSFFITGYTYDATKNIALSTSTNLNPQGMTRDSAGNFWVVDIRDTSISKYSPAGVFDSSATINLITANVAPAAVAADPDDNLWVADTLRDRIYKYSSAGANDASATIVLNSTLNRSPLGMWIDPDGTFWVGDSTDKIYRYSSAGVFDPDTVIDMASGNRSPQGVARDPLGNFWVPDTSDKLFKYSPDGENDPDATIDLDSSITDPTGIHIDSDGSIWVLDANAPRRLHFYQAESSQTLASVTIDQDVYLIPAGGGAVPSAAGGGGGGGEAPTIANILSAIGGNPTDEQVLTYEATGNTLEWQDPPSGGGGGSGRTVNAVEGETTGSDDLTVDLGSEISITSEFTYGALSFGSDGSIWLISAGDEGIFKFGADGSAMAGDTVSVPNTILATGGMIANADGTFWVAVWLNDSSVRLLKLSSSGSLTQTVVPPSSVTGPNGLEADSSGNVWLLDSATKKIYGFTSAGVALASSTVVTLDSSNTAPRALGIDTDDNFLVVDDLFDSTARTYTRRIFKYSSDGTYQADDTVGYTLPNQGAVEGAALDSDGDLWIIESIGNATRLYRLASDKMTVLSSITIDNVKYDIPSGGGSEAPQGGNQVIVPSTISSEQSVAADGTLTVNASTVNAGPYVTMGSGSDAGKLVFSRNGILRVGIGITCRIGSANGRCNPGINITGTGIQVLGRSNGYYRATNVNKQLFRSIDLLVTQGAVGTIQLINPNEAFQNATLLVSSLSHIVMFSYGGVAGAKGEKGDKGEAADSVTPVPYITGDPHYWVRSGDGRVITLILHDIDITDANRNTNQLLVNIGGNPFRVNPWAIATAPRRINIELSDTQANNITSNFSQGNDNVVINVQLRQGASTTLQSITANFPIITPSKAIALKEDVGTFAVVATDSTVTPPRITQFSVNGVTYQV